MYIFTVILVCAAVALWTLVGYRWYTGDLQFFSSSQKDTGNSLKPSIRRTISTKRSFNRQTSSIKLQRNQSQRRNPEVPQAPRTLRLPPSPKLWLPLVGHALEFDINNPQKTLLRLAKIHGTVVGISFGIVKNSLVLVSCPKLATKLLAGDNISVFKGPGYSAISSVSPHNIVVQEGNAWKQAHRVAVSSLRNTSAKLSIVAKQAHIFFSDLAQECISTPSNLSTARGTLLPGVTVSDLSHRLRRLTLDIILEVVLGAEGFRVRSQLSQDLGLGTPGFRASLHTIMSEWHHRALSLVPIWELPDVGSIAPPRQKTLRSSLSIVKSYIREAARLAPISGPVLLKKVLRSLPRAMSRALSRKGLLSASSFSNLKISEVSPVQSKMEMSEARSNHHMRGLTRMQSIVANVESQSQLEEPGSPQLASIISRQMSRQKTGKWPTQDLNWQPEGSQQSSRFMKVTLRSSTLRRNASIKHVSYATIQQDTTSRGSGAIYESSTQLRSSIKRASFATEKSPKDTVSGDFGAIYDNDEEKDEEGSQDIHVSLGSGASPLTGISKFNQLNAPQLTAPSADHHNHDDYWDDIKEEEEEDAIASKTHTITRTSSVSKTPDLSDPPFSKLGKKQKSLKWQGLGSNAEPTDSPACSLEDCGLLPTILAHAVDAPAGQKGPQEVSGTALDIVEGVVFTLLAMGHESVSTLTSWVVYLLALHPEEQENAYQESIIMKQCEAQFEETDIQDSEHLQECLSSMPYIGAVIKEALRLYPSIPMMSRSFVKSEGSSQLGDFLIPKGSEIVVSPYVLHRLPSFWTEPDDFKPSRWLPGGEYGDAPPPPGLYMPFGRGPRACIGQGVAVAETKILVSMLLMDFKIVPLGNWAKNGIPESLFISLRPKDQPIRLVPRSLCSSL